MPTNDFKPFAVAAGANVLSQADYSALAALSTGWQSGVAKSPEVNKAIRQATFIAAAIAQYVSDKAGVDVLDDGNVGNFVAKLVSALNLTSQPLDATLTAIAGLVGAANKLAYFNGTDSATLTDFTDVGRGIVGKGTIADVLTYLGVSQALDLRQPVNATLTAFAQLDGQPGNSADNIPYFSGKNAVTTTVLTAFMRSMFGKADASSVLSLLGVPDLLNDRQPINATLTAFAQLDGQPGNAADNLPYFSAKNTVITTALTAFMRSMLAKANASDVLSLLGTKTAALRDVGTGTNQIPDMSSFIFSNATQGFMKYPGGFIEQWFIATIPQAPSATVNGTIDVLFPNPFPNKCYGLNVNYAGTSATRDGTPFVSGMVVDKFACRLASTYLNSGLDVFVRAVGY